MHFTNRKRERQLALHPLQFHFQQGIKQPSSEYRLGVGHVKWPKRYEDIPAGGDAAVFNTLRNNPNAQLKNKMEHAIAAALLATVQKVSPKPFEVMAALCDDALSARNESFENYAANFGMNEDSIKAKRAYDYCCELYYKLSALIGHANIVKFEELHRQF